MSSLKEHWNSIYLNGLTFQDSLKRSLLKDSTFLYKSTAEDLAGILSRFQKTVPDRDLLLELYRHTNLHNYHAYQADELTKRVEFLRRIDADLVLNQAQINWNNPYFSDDDKFTALRHFHTLQAGIYGFEEDTIHAVDRGVRHLNDKPCISNGSHDLINNTIFINTHIARENDTLLPSYRRSYADAAVTIGHEGVHTKQTWFGRHLASIENPECRAVAEIMDLNAFGDYYLSFPFKDYKLNPCEQEAFDFQDDLQAFLDASAENRTALLDKIESRRDAHLNHRNQVRPAYNLSFAIAA